MDGTFSHYIVDNGRGINMKFVYCMLVCIFRVFGDEHLVCSSAA